MTHADRHALHFGPYRAPALKRGDRAFCLARDCLVVVTSWTGARLPWPRCRTAALTGHLVCTATPWTWGNTGHTLPQP